MLSQSLKSLYWLLLGGTIASASQATVYPLPPPDTDVIGEIKVIHARKEDTLIDIARANGLGYDEMVHANPGVDRWAPGEGTPIVLPARYILPDTPREGIVLNIPEMRLYYYPPASAGGERVVYTYPVSIGRMDWKTPLGTTKVIGKEVDPPWRPPASIKAEHAKDGEILPDVVPGGEGNPLGRFAMRLGVPGYLIHGTDKPYGIGMQVTHGCVRMYPEDIEHLFKLVGMGTTVRLIDQPVKVGRFNGELLVEAHQPLEEDESPIKVTPEQVRKAVIAKAGPDMSGVDQTTLQVAADQISGIPVSISGQSNSAATGSLANQTMAPPGAAYSPPPVRTPTPAPYAAPGPTTAANNPSYPITNRTAPPRETPDSPYRPSTVNSNTPAPDYRNPSQASTPYPTPYGNATAPPTAAYRPVPAPAPRYSAPYNNASPNADYPQPSQRPATAATIRPVDTPAYRPAPSGAPVDTPAYRSTSPASLPVEARGYRSVPPPPPYPRNPGAANYQEEEPPYVYQPAAPTTEPPSVRPVYRTAPAGAPVPYPRPVTPMAPPTTNHTPPYPLQPSAASRL